jgi:hypothetical protein
MIHDLNEKFNNNLWHSLRDSFWNNFGLRDNIKDILKRCVTDAQNVEKTNDE